VVLAAGGSSRLGRPKQLLASGGETLVHRAARAAGGSGADETLVVTGAYAGRVAGAVADLALPVVENRAWQEGLASSIRCGVRAAGERGSSAVLLVLADQPRVGSALLARLLGALREEGRELVACRYLGLLGAPALFAGPWRELLLELRGDRGARGLLRAHAERVRAVPFEPAALDVDDEAGWRAYRDARRAGPTR